MHLTIGKSLRNYQKIENMNIKFCQFLKLNQGCHQDCSCSHFWHHFLLPCVFNEWNKNHEMDT